MPEIDEKTVSFVLIGTEFGALDCPQRLLIAKPAGPTRDFWNPLGSQFDWRPIAETINPLTHLFSRLEMRDVLGGNMYLLARFRIAPDACRAMVECETADPANLNAIPSGQRLANGVENFQNRDFSVFGHQFREAGRKGSNEVRACHSAQF